MQPYRIQQNSRKQKLQPTAQTTHFGKRMGYGKLNKSRRTSSLQPRTQSDSSRFPCHLAIALYGLWSTPCSLVAWWSTPMRFVLPYLYCHTCIAMRAGAGMLAWIAEIADEDRTWQTTKQHKTNGLRVMASLILILHPRRRNEVLYYEVQGPSICQHLQV